MAEYPKLVPQVWRTSDGKWFDDEANAAAHEERIRVEPYIRQAIRQAVADAKFTMYGEARGVEDRRFHDRIVDELMARGVSFSKVDYPPKGGR